MAETYDLLIRAGRLVCPASGLDGPGAVGVRGDRIVASGSDVDGSAASEVEVGEDSVVLPGLVDIHAHPAVEGSKYGVDPDEEFLPRGVTTVMSQGDAGATNWDRYCETTVARSRTRICMAINLSSRGESMSGPCFGDMNDVDVEACVATIKRGGDAIWGIAVNVARPTAGDSDPKEILRRGLEAAERTNRPILFGLREAEDWPHEEQLALLRPGDIVTYSLRPQPFGIVQEGRVHPAVWEAQKRGVIFDAAHGMASLDFVTAEAALAEGFVPNTISTDSYMRHVGADPPLSLPLMISKLRAVGMSEADIFPRVTSRPAAVLGLEGEVGTLAPGACADITVLLWHPDGPALVDVSGAERSGGRWEATLVVRRGETV